MQRVLPVRSLGLTAVCAPATWKSNSRPSNSGSARGKARDGLAYRLTKLQLRASRRKGPQNVKLWGDKALPCLCYGKLCR